MSNRLALALLCMAVSSSAFSQDRVFDIAKGAADLEMSHEATTDLEDEYLESQIALHRAQERTLKLEADRMRLENERIRQENERRLQEAERQRAQVAAQTNETKGADQGAGPDMYEQLRIIGQLRVDGILTDEEFEEQKKKILDKN